MKTSFTAHRGFTGLLLGAIRAPEAREAGLEATREVKAVWAIAAACAILPAVSRNRVVTGNAPDQATRKGLLWGHAAASS